MKIFFMLQLGVRNNKQVLMMNEKQYIKRAEQFVKTFHNQDTTGHDWHHISRVRNSALYIKEQEQSGNKFIIEMSALLHDIPDEKLNQSKEEGDRRLNNFLESLHLEQKVKQEIISCISTVSFKGGKAYSKLSIEAQIVQDADRLDAMGALGIARAFAYSGASGQEIYNPDLPVRTAMNEAEYRTGKSSAINHFYEKLLKLKGLLHTNTAKRLANDRHLFMEAFLDEFFKEWNGQK